MANGVVDKYANVISFYKCPQNMEESRKYTFQFSRYSPNNYTLYLMNNYTLNELRGIARMCKDNAFIYGQVPWCVQNARMIRLSACKETTVFGLHTYLYYKYVALHMRLSRPRPIFKNSRFLSRIQKVLNRWIIIRAKENMENARQWARLHNNIAKAAAQQADIFKQRMTIYKNTVKVELTNLDYELDEYKYQYQQSIRDVNQIHREMENNKDYNCNLHSELFHTKMKLAEMEGTIKRHRYLIGEEMKNFVYNYVPQNQFPLEPYQFTLPQNALINNESLIQYNMEVDTSDNDMNGNTVEESIHSSSIAETQETQYIMNRLPMGLLYEYFKLIEQYTDIQKNIQIILNKIEESSKIEIEWNNKYSIAVDAKRKKQELVNRVRDSILVVENALLRKRKFDFKVIKIDSSNNINNCIETCPICLDDVSQWATTNCGHNYCKSCISKSLNSIYSSPLKPYKCALCRNKISTLSTHTNSVKYHLETRYIFTSCYVSFQ